MFKPGDKMLAIMPMFHGFGLGVSIHSMLVNGGRCILIPRFTPQTYAVLLCTTLLAQVFRLFICRGLFGLSIPDFLRRALWRIVLTGVPCIAAPLALLRAWNPQSVAGHFGFVALCLLWTALSVGALGLEGRERQFVFQKFNRLIHKR